MFYGVTRGRATGEGHHRRVLRSLTLVLRSDSKDRHVAATGLTTSINISRTTLCHRFPDGAHVFSDLVRFVRSDLVAHVGLVLGSRGSAATHLHLVILLLLNFNRHGPNLAHVLANRTLVFRRSHLRKHVGRLFRHVRTRLHRMLHRGEVHRNRNCAASRALLTDRVLTFYRNVLSHFIHDRFGCHPASSFSTH